VHGLCDTFLDKDSELDSDAFGILDNLAITKYGVDFGARDMLGVHGQRCQPLLLVECVAAGRLPLQYLGDSRFRLRRLSPNFVGGLHPKIFQCRSVDFKRRVTEV
jgi:hypothetical protein